MPRNHLSQRNTAIVIAALAPMTWGTSYYVATEWLPADRPLLAAAVRALPAGLLLVAATRQLPRGLTTWFRVTTLGILNIGAFFALLFASAYHLPGGVAATLGAIQPLIVAGLSHRVLAERFTSRALATGVVGIVGIAILVLRGDAALDVTGVAAGLLGAASMAGGVVLAKKWGRPPGMTNIAHTGWMLTMGGAVLVPIMAAVEGLPEAVDGRNVAGFSYLILVNTALAYVLWMRGISQLPASQITYLGLLSPITATLVGWAALGEALTSLQLLGLALALGSVLAAQSAFPPVRYLKDQSEDTAHRSTPRPAMLEAAITAPDRT